MSEPARQRKPDLSKGLDRAQKFGTILMPHEAEEPILAAGVRLAIYEWLTEIRSRAELEAVGLTPRSTALLYGPPGTGKTTLAHHLSARLGLPLVAVQSERLVGMHLGETGRNIAELFDGLADAEHGCVVLLDEIDGIGSTRSSDPQACAREMNMALTTLLTRVEAFRGMCIAATNRKESLDPALWRRFGMQISVDLPGGEERFAILKRYAAPFDFGDDALDLITDITQGASPALLRQLMEGLKRALVLHPRLGLKIDDVAIVFRAITSAVAPHPDLPQPPLWKSFETHARKLREIPWPPARQPQKKGA
ncbi:ATP-binding protein [Xanthobacter sp. DSM 14520]|uniref:AAA family ATPase n=1 Tax=Xanthobacter autotrophicus (strain ATCC BAA-1158 / Py2) TaxID=78245 RepID=UPI00372AC048